MSRTNRMSWMLAVLASMAWLPLDARGMCLFTGLPVHVYPSGGALPPSPDLYVFTPYAGRYVFAHDSDDSMSVQVEDVLGRRVPVRIHALPSEADYEVHRIEIAVKDPGPIRLYITYRGQRTLKGVYSISSTPLPQVPQAVRVLGQGVTAPGIVCPVELTRDLYVSEAAPAYRVVFAESSQAYRAGRTLSAVVPARTEGGDPALQGALPPRGQGIAPLGLLPCYLGPTFPWQDFHDGVFVGVSALRADGTETPLPTEPIRVEPP